VNGCPPDLSTAVYGIVGAAVSLGGLLLVFSGLLYTRAAGFPPATSDAIIGRYKRAAALALVPFGLSLVVAVVGSLYSWQPSHSAVIGSVTLGLFVALAVLTMGYGVAASRLL